jgi:hypothetical protein
MDPVVTTIVAALVAGATAATKQIATEAIKDVYQKLKRLVVEKSSDASDPIKAIEKNPDSSPERAALAKALNQTPSAQDAEVKATAQALLDAIDKLRSEPAAAALFDFDRLRVARNVQLSDIEALGTVFRAKDAEIAGDFIASNVHQKMTGGEERKN